MSMMLTPDAQVPGLTVETLSGDQWNLADQTPENFTMVVFKLISPFEFSAVLISFSGFATKLP